MTDLKKADNNFNLPSFVNVPLFVLQESKLDFFNKFLFSFFWNLSQSGKSIFESNEYIAALFCVTERHVRNRIKELEEMGFIKRVVFKNKRYIEVLYTLLTKSEEKIEQ